MSFIDKARARKEDFLRTYGVKDFALEYYVPQFYQRMAEQIKKNGETISPDAVNEIVSNENTGYIVIFNMLHRAMHEMHSPDEADMNPREARYQEVQYAESLAWLVIKIIDDIIDEADGAKNKISTHEIADYINKTLFENSKNRVDIAISPAKKEALDAVASCLREELQSLGATEKFKEVLGKLGNAWHREVSAKNMQEYRKARGDVGVESSNLSLFFILGAGDEQYTKRYFNGTKAVENIIQLMGEAGNYFDSFVDFKHDQKETLGKLEKDGEKEKIAEKQWFLSPALGDRAWFLYATIKKVTENLTNVDIKQFSHLSGIFLSHVLDKTTKFICSKEKNSEFKKNQDVTERSKALFLDVALPLSSSAIEKKLTHYNVQQVSLQTVSDLGR